jgi:chemotaxis protein CheY-P-specific phosphatase CheC
MSKIERSLSSALPKDFGFYGLGEVTLSEERSAAPDFDFNDKTALAFTIFGDRKLSAVVVFDQGLDESMYTEMGNVIMSRAADNLSARLGYSVLISPPYRIDIDLLQSILASAKDSERRTYIHTDSTQSTEICVFLIPSAAETANA